MRGAMKDEILERKNKRTVYSGIFKEGTDGMK
jgi:hypothetical protein